MGLNVNPYSNTPIKNLEYIQNKALVIAPFEITKNGKLDTDLMLDTPGSITMYFFRKNFNDIDKEPTAEQFKTVGTVSDISTKLGLDITSSNISSSSSSSYYLGFTKINVIFKYDKNTGMRTIEKDNSLLGGDYTDIGIDNTCDLTAEDYFVICNVTKNTKATNSSFTESASMDFLFMIPSSECQEIITDFDILDVNNKTINVKKYGTVGSGFVADKDTTIEPAYQADFLGDGSNIATYLFDGTTRDLNGNYNGTPTAITYGEGKVGKCALFNGATSFVAIPNNTINVGTQFSISLWFNPSTLTGAIKGIISKCLTAVLNFSPFIINQLNSNIKIYLSSNGTSWDIANGTTLNTVLTINTWYHLIFIKTSTSYDIYINGIKDISISSSANLVNNNQPITIGKNDGSGASAKQYFTGSIDQVRIFNRALTSNEVTALYLNNGVPRVIKQETNVVPSLVTSKPDFFKDGSNIATYLFNGTCNDETGNYNGTGSGVSYVKGKFGQAAVFSSSGSTYITIPTSLYPAQTQNATISMWIDGRIAGSGALFSQQDSGQWVIFSITKSGNAIELNYCNATTWATSLTLALTTPTNGFFHFAFVQSGYTIYSYINGSLVSVNTLTALTRTTTTYTHIGCYFNGPGVLGNKLNGVLDNYRIFNRPLNQREVLELYNEQPSYEEQLTLTEVTGKTLTPSGNPLVVYDRDIGPSIKFVNNRDYFSLPGTNDFAFGTGDFTVESWVKFNNPISTYPTQYICMLNTTGGIGFGIESGNLGFGTRAVSFEINYSWVPTTGVWYHLAATRENGVMKLWINGSNVATKTSTKNLSINTGTFYIGAATPDLADNFYGYISQLHIVKGVAKYTTAAGNFTPESRLLRTPNTVLLLQVDKPVVNTNNWSKIQLESVEAIPTPNIIEQTGKVITNSGVTIDTTIVSDINKINSIYFNNSSNLSIPASNDFSFGTGNFTIELMVNIKSYPVNQYNYTSLLTNRLYRAGLTGSWGINFNGGSTPGRLVFGEVIASPTQVLLSKTYLALNTWYHLAFVRNNGKLSLYINGVLDITIDHTINYSANTQPLLVGTNTDANGYFNGYMQDIRITKGVALYSSNFTPKTDLVKDTNTSLLIQSYQISPTIKDPKRKDFFGDKSMVACYMLDSNANDETGMYNGTATNITYTDGKFGKCAIFNGSTSKISSDINLNSNNFSISFWGNLSNIQSTHSFILGTINGANRYGIRMTNFDKLEPNIWTGVDNVFGVDANWSNYANTWTNYVFSIANNTCYFYINGELKTTKTFTNNVIFNGVNIGYGQGGIYNIAGQIDNVKIFNRALTDSEVTSLYNETISPIITLETESEAIASEPDFFNDKSNIATYLFNNNVNDANGNYNGTGTNIIYGTGKFGTGVNIPTSNGEFKVDTGITLNTFAISMWFKRVNLTDFIGFVNFPTLTNKLYLYGSTNGSKIAIGKHAISETLSTTTITDLNWHHIVMNYDFTTSKATIYIDGVVTSINNTVIANMITTPSPITLFAGSVTGCFDNVRIFNRALTESEVQDLFRETKRVKYKAITLDETNFGPASKINIETQKEIKLLNYKTWTGIDATSQGYRIYPVMKISDHTTEETTFNPKYYLGTKYQRNLSEILSQGIKSKRTIFNLKDMYLVDELCIQTLRKINILLENDQMIKFTERLYNLATPLREKLNADLILEYLSTPVSGSSNSDIADILKTSLMEDYNFTQEEIDNLNVNLNTFKSRARMNISTPVIQGSNGSLDQLRFSLPKTFADNNRSQTEKKNLLVFGTNSGFNKFNLAGYTAPYSNITKRDVSVVLDYNNLTLGLPALSSQNFKPVVDDKTFMMYSGSLTDATGKRPTLTGGSLSTITKKFNDSSIYINNSFITIPAGANLSIGTKDFTVETWINQSSIVDVPIFTLGLNQSQCCFIVYLLSNGAVLFRAGSGGWSWDFASDRTTASNLVKANTWNHIVTQRRNGNLEIYINGILYYTGVWAYNIPNGTNLYIGGYVGGSNITAYYDDISISNGVGRYTSNFTLEIPNTFKDILTNYKQQIPFTYIPLSTDAANTNNGPVFENLTDITGFNNNNIIIDVPNVL